MIKGSLRVRVYACVREKEREKERKRERERERERRGGQKEWARRGGEKKDPVHYLSPNIGSPTELISLSSEFLSLFR